MRYGAPKCTAPVKGHTSLAAVRTCPACRHDQVNALLKAAPPTTIMWLLTSQNSAVQETVIKDARTSPTILRDAVRHALQYDKVELLANLAASQRLKSDDYFDLAAYARECEAPAITAALSRNPRTPGEVLDSYARSENRAVRSQALQNPSLPEATMWDLLAKSDEFSDHPYWVSINPSATGDLLRTAYDQSAGRKTALSHIARHHNAPPDILDELATTCSIDVSDNPSALPSTLLRLANHSNYYVRCAIARNPTSPDAALDIVASHPEVRDELINHLRRRPHLPPKAIHYALTRPGWERTDHLIELRADHFATLGFARDNTRAHEALAALEWWTLTADSAQVKIYQRLYRD